MWELIAGIVREEAKKHPHFIIMILLMGAAVTGYSYRVFAQQVYVDTKFNAITDLAAERFAQVDARNEQLDLRIAQVEQTINQRHYEQRLADIEREIFQLERLDQNKHATDRDLSRLSNLRIERNELTRTISAYRSL